MSRYKAYPEYKDSGVDWLGRIPISWDALPIKRVSEIFNGATPKSGEDTYWDGDISWITPADLGKSKSPYINKGARSISRAGYESCGTSLVPEGTIVLSSRAPIGALGIATKELCTNQGCKSLIVEKEHSNKYLYYVLLSSTEQLNLLGRGTTFLELSTDELGSHKIGLPSKSEQEIIANFLDHETAKIDILITKQQQLIKLLKEKRQAVISHAVTKGLNPNAPMRDSSVAWLGEVPENWKLVPLKYLCKFSGGGTPSKENLSYWTGGDIPWVSPKDMKYFWLSDTQDKLTEIAVAESSTNFVESGALLIVVRSGILQRTIPIAVNTVRVTLNQDMKALRFNSQINVEYAANFILGNQNSLLFDWSKEGATVESIEHEYLSNSLFPVPPLEEQESINKSIKMLMDVFQGIEKQAIRGITLLQERRTALISAAVTGKIDVRNWQPPKARHSKKKINKECNA